MKTKIVSDSGASLFSLESVDYQSVPLTISTEERSFVDDESLDLVVMLDYLASYKGTSHTACPSINAWVESFGDADEVYAVTLSSNLSGSYNSAQLACQEYMEAHPTAKTHVFDSLSAGTEQQMIIYKVQQLILEGKSFEEVVSETEDYLRHTRILFALKSFHNFAANGRVSKVAATAAGLLGIRVLATGNPRGIIDIVAKCRGDKGTIKAFLENLKKAGCNGKKFFINHTFADEFVDMVTEALKQEYPDCEIIYSTSDGLCAFYEERGGLLLGFEVDETFKDDVHDNCK